MLIRRGWSDGACSARGPFSVNAGETVYQNYQRLTLQESPGSVPPGRLPRQKEVVLLADLIDVARPGEEVEVTGIYCSGYDSLLNVRNGFPVFSTHIEANWVSKAADQFAAYKMTDEDKAEIIKLSADPRIGACVRRVGVVFFLCVRARVCVLGGIGWVECVFAALL